jgi:hypothetical protein
MRNADNVNDLLPQLLPAIGVLVGIAAKSLFDVLLEGRRWRREDQVRWVERRRDAYIGFVRAQRVLEFRGVQAALLRSLDSTGSAETIAQADKERAAAESDARQHLDDLDFLAPAAVLAAARVLRDAVDAVVEAAQTAEVGNQQAAWRTLEPKLDAVERAADDFKRCARQDLGTRSAWRWTRRRGSVA